MLIWFVLLVLKFDDSITDEYDKYANQMEAVLVEQMADNGKEASKAYGNSYLDSIKKQMEDGNEIDNVAMLANFFHLSIVYLDDKKLGDQFTSKIIGHRL